MRLLKGNFSRLLVPVVVGAGSMYILLSAMDAVAEWRNERIQVGDIVGFGAAGTIPVTNETRLYAVKEDRSDCTLDMSVLHRFGGSFVVTAKGASADEPVLVHWSGQRTAEGAGNCGSKASLLVDTDGFEILRSEAASYGP